MNLVRILMWAFGTVKVIILIKTIRLKAILEDNINAKDLSFYLSLIGKSRDTVIYILGEPEQNHERTPESEDMPYLVYPEVFMELAADYQVESVALEMKKDQSTDDII